MLRISTSDVENACFDRNIINLIRSQCQSCFSINKLLYYLYMWRKFLHVIAVLYQAYLPRCLQSCESHSKVEPILAIFLSWNRVVVGKAFWILEDINISLGSVWNIMLNAGWTVVLSMECSWNLGTRSQWNVWHGPSLLS